jgi:hypothetical protein
MGVLEPVIENDNPDALSGKLELAVHLDDAEVNLRLPEGPSTTVVLWPILRNQFWQYIFRQ